MRTGPVAKRHVETVAVGAAESVHVEHSWRVLEGWNVGHARFRRIRGPAFGFLCPRDERGVVVAVGGGIKVPVGSDVFLADQVGVLVRR